jgi:uncharacterized protein
MNYNFDWDPGKAKMNQRKHRIAFEVAATVFNDPRALSLYDDDHSRQEDRWITLGLAASGGLLVVHHTYEPVDDENVRIRIFSSRKALSYEIQQYEGELHEKRL